MGGEKRIVVTTEDGFTYEPVRHDSPSCCSTVATCIAYLVSFIIGVLVTVVAFKMGWLACAMQASNDHISFGVETAAASQGVACSSCPSLLPSKYSVEHPIPVKNQWFRGLCWAFATVAMLEHHYRIQGIRMGLLQPNEYVQFSEQAFAETIVSLCDQHHENCVRFGEIGYHSTNGGDAGVLAIFSKSLSKRIMPVSVCPYEPWQKDEWKCPGLEKALPTNPIEMTVRRFESFYDVESIKRALIEADGRSMTLSVPWFNTALWMPCEGPTAEDVQCKPKKDGSCKHYCPTEFNYGERCCKKIMMPNYNGDGELYENHAMDLAGGHLMLLVGYSDTFMTQLGDRGGFIVRNSWGPTGSHSIAYWKREISETDELVSCPNHDNPRYWAQCSEEDRDEHGENYCVSKVFKEQMEAQRLAVELKCVDSASCHVEDEYTYVALNATWERTTLMTMCFNEYKDGEFTGEAVCQAPVPGGNLVRHTPTVPMLGLMQAKHPRQNDPDVCGHYFFPYSLLEKTIQHFGNVVANRVTIDFSRGSYLTAGMEGDARYSLLKSSTSVQAIHKFASQYPDTDLDPAMGL